MQTRRNFIGHMATGLAGSLATGRVLGAHERVRFGVIGMGDRGIQLAREASASPDAEFAGFADIYARRLEDAAKLAPNARAYPSWEELLSDDSIGTVFIATPSISTPTLSSPRSNPASTSILNEPWLSRWTTRSACAPPPRQLPIVSFRSVISTVRAAPRRTP